MTLNTKALSLTFGFFWGGHVLLIGLANWIWPPYGESFLNLAASLYPGYSGGSSLAEVFFGTCYAFVDGLVGGLIFGWIYNALVLRMSIFARRAYRT